MISIIIPAREEEKVIRSTIEQLRKINLPHEIIVADGRSSDRTVEIARQFSDVVVVFEGEKHTAGIARNDGARAAHGEFFAFVDTDTFIPDPEPFFRRALAHFDDPTIVGVCAPQRALPEIETWADRLSFGWLNFMLRLQNNWLHRSEASGKFLIVRADAFKKVNGFREDLVTREDGDFFLRLSRIGRTVFDPSLMVYHGARRAHKIGWGKLWYIWIANTISVTLWDKAVANDWTPIR